MTAGAAGLLLGAPGVYRASRAREPAFGPVRLDATAFVGIAPRGPVDEPVLVESWSDYRRWFGGFRHAGSLPYAVRAFFDQGGERAWVVRVAPPDGAEAATAAHRLAALGLDVVARDEGLWGDRLSIRVSFERVRRFAGVVTGTGLPLPDGVAVAPGSLLRLRRADLPAAGELRWVLDVAAGRPATAVLDRPLPDGISTAPCDVTVVTALVEIRDADPDDPRAERFAGLGLRPHHRRFLPDVLAEESLLVAPAGEWRTAVLLPPDPLLLDVVSTRVRGGADRRHLVGTDCFFDDADDPLDERPVHHGVDAAARITEIGLLTVPDLQWSSLPEPTPLEPPPPEPPSCPDPCGGQAPTREPDRYSTPPPPEPLLDAEEIAERQRRLVRIAEGRRQFVALLDVPARMPGRAIARWRAGFDSSHAAAYHPWLTVVDPLDPARRARLVPPSAFAAGIIAARERRLGLSFGPANEIAAGAVGASAPVTDAEHDDLHALGIDVFRAERDGFRLTAARTLSIARDYRQLSVRRLMTMLRLVLERQAQWVVFEPSTPQLRGLLRHTLTALLRELYRGGAFTGDTEQQAFFVRCDDALNPPVAQALGRLVAEVGVAPAEPMEYLVLRISQDADGALRVEDGRA